MPLRDGFDVEIGPEWYRVPGQLDEENDDAPQLLDDALKKAAERVAAVVRARALAIPATGRKHTGLRGRMAAGVTTSTVDGVTSIRASAVPGEAGAVIGMDQGPTGWRHPVYGNRDVWVQQRGYRWFREPIADHREEMERDLTEVLEGMAKRVDLRGIGS